jgi:hypothetical protein
MFFRYEKGTGGNVASKMQHYVLNSNAWQIFIDTRAGKAGGWAAAGRKTTFSSYAHLFVLVSDKGPHAGALRIERNTDERI